MLQINNLTITHRYDSRVIIKDFNLVLNKGDKAVIIGEEGNGKSSLLKWIYDSDLISDYADFSGGITDSSEIKAYLPQQLEEYDEEKTVYQYFCENDSFLELSPKQLALYSQQFGLNNDIYYSSQKMVSLSGGEKIKIQMIRLLMSNPTLLLLDEPSNDIDISTLKWLEKFINDFKGIVLYISHDEILIENTANMIIHLEQLKRKSECHHTIVHQSYRDYLSYRAGNIEKQQQMAASDKREKRIRDEKYQRIFQSVEYAQDTISRGDPATARLLKKKMKAVKSMEKRFEKQDENMTKNPDYEEAIYFRIGDESCRIPSGKTVLDFHIDSLYTADNSRLLSGNIDLTVKGSEKIGIIGDNGVGKTTLLKEIYLSLKDRKDIKVFYMPQHYEEILDMNQNVIDYLDETGRKEERSTIATYLGSLKYTYDEMNHAIKDLSGGQKAKVLLLKMDFFKANVLLLDEPTRNFSPLSAPVIRQQLIDFPGAIISISHDRKYLSEVCDILYRLTPQGISLYNSEDL